MTSAATPRRRRWSDGLLGGGVALVALAIWAACFRFPAVWDALGIGESTHPFLDLHGLLAANDAARAGANPYLPNQLDLYHRPLVYTEWWLALGAFGLTRADTLWLGWVLLGATLLAAVAIVRPRGRCEGMAFLLWLVSPAMLLTVNRANNDLVIFVVMTAGLAALRRSGSFGHGLAVVAFAVAAVLKYYPLAGLIVLLEASRRREIWAGLALYALVAVLAWPALAPGLASAARYRPQSEWLYAFGAPVLFRDFGIRTTVGWLALAMVVSVGAGWSALRPAPAEVGTTPSREREREFMVGAALIVGCFFLGASYVYKLVFSAWMLPWLWREEHGTLEGRWRRATGRLLVGVLWLEGVMALVMNGLSGAHFRRFAEGLLVPTLVVSQLLEWLLMGCLLRFLLAYALRRGRELCQPDHEC